ncbi:MAG: hypothetical protein GC181_15870 [Bacteroidetes bacterium]|nr:hypothetical protein [Bacteroidota bacterium]
MKLKIAASIGVLLFLSSCKDDSEVDQPVKQSSGFHNNLNGWNYIGKATNTISNINSPQFMSYKLFCGNTFNNKVDIVYQFDNANDYPTTQRAHRLIFNADGSTFFFGTINVDIYPYSASTTASREIKSVATKGLLEDDICMVIGSQTNSNLITSAIKPRYKSEHTEVFTTLNGSPILWKKQASDLTPDNGFFGNYFMVKPLYKGDQYPITFDETSGNVHVAGYVEDDGTLTLASVGGGAGFRALSLFKSSIGLENINWNGVYAGPVHHAIPKHNLSVASLSNGDANTDLSKSLFVRINGSLYMVLAFTNGETRLVEADRKNYILKVNSDYVYPESVAKENWIGLSARDIGTVYTYSTGPFTINEYDGHGTSSVQLPDFKNFTPQEGGVVGVTMTNDRLYLMIYNEYDIYIYTKDL